MGDPNVAYARDERSVRHCPGVSGVFARWIVTPLLLASGSKLAGRASNVTANEPFARGTCANSLCGGRGFWPDHRLRRRSFQQSSASNWLVSVRAHRDFLP